MANSKKLHITPKSNGNSGKKWDVKREGSSRASRSFVRKNDAVEWAKDVARKERGEVIPHGKDGRIQNPNSYGNDPCPPKDKKH